MLTMLDSARKDISIYFLSFVNGPLRKKVKFVFWSRFILLSFRQKYENPTKADTRIMVPMKISLENIFLEVPGGGRICLLTVLFV